MKKQLFLSLFAVCAIAGSAMAQEPVQAAVPQQQGMQQKAPNERAKETLIKLQADLGVTNDQGAKVYAVFENYYTAQQKAMEEMRASGTFDRDAMKANRDKMMASRDEQLKGILTADQYTKWKDVVEPSMRPQRRGDGGGKQ